MCKRDMDLEEDSRVQNTEKKNVLNTVELNILYG
jgi:hypothetical protein